jgi:dipeptidyl-peptidase-4
MSMHRRYAAAEKLLAPVAIGKIRNASPTVRWIDQSDACWYQRTTADGHEWVRIEAPTGARSPAFDHGQVAALLRQHGHEADAGKLPITVTRIASTSVDFSCEKKRYRLPLDGSELIALGDDEGAHGPSRSPDGRWQISQIDGNLWLAESDGSAKQITTDGEPDNGYAIYHGNYKAGHIPRSRTRANGQPAGVVWSPDSSKAIVWHIDQRHVAPYPLLETAPQDGSFRPKVHAPRLPLTGERPPTIRWLCLDVQTQRLTPLQLPEDQLHLHQDWEAVRKWIWSPDCSHAWAVVFGVQMKTAYLIDVDLATGESRIVISESDAPRVELNTTAYSQVAVDVIADLDQVIWYSHRSDWGHLYRYDGKTGRLLNAITQGAWLVRDLIDVDRASGRVLFTASGREPGNPYLRSLYAVNLDGSELRRITPAGIDADINPGLSAISKTTEFIRQLSPSGEYLVYTRSTVTHPPQTVIVRLSDASETVIEEADISELLAYGYEPPEEFVTLAADGQTEIHGLLYRPHGLPTDSRAPLMVGQYASPLMAACPRTYVGAVAGLGLLVSPAAYAALGCAVMLLDARGTTNRDRGFATAGQNELHLIGMDDYVAAIRQLGERHPWIDTGRVGISGGSYGGFATIRAMIEFPDVFTVGIAGAPFISVHGMYPDVHWTGWHGVPDYGDGCDVRPSATARPRNYENMDASLQVDRIKGRLLVLAAELDENCPIGPIMQFYAAAIDADAPVELVLLPNRNHYTLARTRYTYRLLMDYFCRHLLDQPPPRDFRFESLPQSTEPDDRATAW